MQSKENNIKAIFATSILNAKQTNVTKTNLIGVMAGSSMDGLDVAMIELTDHLNTYAFKVIKAATLPYDQQMEKLLHETTNADRTYLRHVDEVFGRWIALHLSPFIGNRTITLVGVHGHTAIHRPQQQISWQLGDGQIIANELNIPVVANFRSLDVQLGGQGAPLVPIGDFSLFQEYHACLNLGGIANVSLRDHQLAWDICPCNQVLNYFASKVGEKYDEGGRLSGQGSVDHAWIARLNENNYFKLAPPKSLPNSYLSKELLDEVPPLDGLRSYCEFISDRITKEVAAYLGKGRLLVTGGGTYHELLISLLRKKLYPIELIVPDKTIIDFKEAIVFALLAYLKQQNRTNVLKAVTGASRDSSSGQLFFPLH